MSNEQPPLWRPEQFTDDVDWSVHKEPMALHVQVTWGDQVAATVVWQAMDVTTEQLVAVIRALLNDQDIEGVFPDGPDSPLGL